MNLSPKASALVLWGLLLTISAGLDSGPEEAAFRVCLWGGYPIAALLALLLALIAALRSSRHEEITISHLLPRAGFDASSEQFSAPLWITMAMAKAIGVFDDLEIGPRLVIPLGLLWAMPWVYRMPLGQRLALRLSSLQAAVDSAPRGAKRSFWTALLVSIAAISVYRLMRVRTLERSLLESRVDLLKLSRHTERADYIAQRVDWIKAYARAEKEDAASRRACPGFFSLLQKTLSGGRLELETLDMKMAGAALQVSAGVRSRREADLAQWRSALAAAQARDDAGELRDVAVILSSASKGSFHETVSMTYLWKKP